MGKEQAGNPEREADTAAERFRTHLRERLQQMRENARRIGASSSYIESLDRSADAVLTAVTAAKAARDTETVPADAAPRKTPKRAQAKP
jgi:hypothetical protein